MSTQQVNYNNKNPVNSISTTISPPPYQQQTPIKLGWYERNQKNKPQSNAVATGIILLMVSALHIGYGIFSLELPFYLALHSNIENTGYLLIISIFYVGALVGNLLYALFGHRYGKKVVYIISALLNIAGSGIMAAIPDPDLIPLTIARLIIGIAFGITYPVVIMHAGEVVVKEIRGMILSTLNYCMFSSILLVSILHSIGTYDYNEYSFRPNLYIGIMGVLYSAMSMLFLPLFFKESPIFLIKQGKESEALITMIKLRSETVETWEIRNDFQENKRMIEEDSKLTSFIFSNGNTRPLLLILLSKLLFVLSFNYIINTMRLIYSRDGEYFNYTPSIFLLVRVLAAFLPMFLVDKKGRKIFQTMSGTICSVCLIIFGIVLAIEEFSFWIPFFLFVIYEIGMSLGIGAISDVLLSEGFPISKKSNSICFISFVENLLQIIIILITYALRESDMHTVYIIHSFLFGIVILTITLVLQKLLPETKQMSLRQARDEFRRYGEFLYTGNQRSTGILYT